MSDRSIEEVMDSSTLSRNTEKREQIERNEVGKLTIQTRAPVVIDNHDRIPTLGASLLPTTAKSAAAALSSAGLIPIGRWRRAKTSFGPKEKSRVGNGPLRWDIAAP